MMLDSVFGKDISTEADYSDVVISLYASLLPDFNSSNHNISPYSAWSIPPSKNGLQTVPRTIPKKMIDSGIILVNDEDYSTTITPAGSITGWHYDRCDAGTVLQMLDGFKLFIVCPPTPNNMRHFSTICRMEVLDQVEKGLHEFEDVRYLVARAGDMFVLPVGELHLVISPVNSAVGGWYCVKDEWKSRVVTLKAWEKKMGWADD